MANSLQQPHARDTLSSATTTEMANSSQQPPAHEIDMISPIQPAEKQRRLPADRKNKIAAPESRSEPKPGSSSATSSPLPKAKPIVTREEFEALNNRILGRIKEQEAEEQLERM